MNSYDTQMMDLVITLLDNGWTQKELALRAGTTQSYISAMSRGKGSKRGPSASIVDGLRALQWLTPPPLERPSREKRMRQQVRHNRPQQAA